MKSVRSVVRHYLRRAHARALFGKTDVGLSQGLKGDNGKTTDLTDRTDRANLRPVVPSMRSTPFLSRATK
jgi:hypothetical protein